MSAKRGINTTRFWCTGHTVAICDILVCIIYTQSIAGIIWMIDFRRDGLRLFQRVNRYQRWRRNRFCESTLCWRRWSAYCRSDVSVTRIATARDTLIATDALLLARYCTRRHLVHNCLVTMALGDSGLKCWQGCCRHSWCWIFN